MPTFRHQIAGSNVITPAGKKLVFAGRHGSPGFLFTDEPSEVSMLMELVKNPQVPMDIVEMEAADVAKIPATPTYATATGVAPPIGRVDSLHLPGAVVPGTLVSSVNAPINKPVDPAIAAAVSDAQANAERAADPAIEAMRARMATLAATSNSDSL